MRVFQHTLRSVLLTVWLCHPCRIMASIRSTYLTDDGFTPENAKRASPAAEGLCKWVHAMSKYDKVRRQRAQPSATAGC